MKIMINLIYIKKSLNVCHIDRLTWKDLFNDFEMHFYRYVFPYYDTLYTLEKLSQKGFQIGVIANGNFNLKNNYEHTVTWFNIMLLIIYQHQKQLVFVNHILKFLKI